MDGLKPVLILRNDPLTDHSYAAHSTIDGKLLVKNEFVFSFPGEVMW